jgi:hypothetical protein
MAATQQEECGPIHGEPRAASGTFRQTSSHGLTSQYRRPERGFEPLAFKMAKRVNRHLAGGQLQSWRSGAFPASAYSLMEAVGPDPALAPRVARLRPDMLGITASGVQKVADPAPLRLAYPSHDHAELDA